MLARHRLSGYNLSGQVRRKAYLASSALMDSTTRVLPGHLAAFIRRSWSGRSDAAAGRAIPAGQVHGCGVP